MSMYLKQRISTHRHSLTIPSVGILHTPRVDSLDSHGLGIVETKRGLPGRLGTQTVATGSGLSGGRVSTHIQKMHIDRCKYICAYKNQVWPYFGNLGFWLLDS